MYKKTYREKKQTSKTKDRDIDELESNRDEMKNPSILLLEKAKKINNSTLNKTDHLFSLVNIYFTGNLKPTDQMVLSERGGHFVEKITSIFSGN